MDEVLSLFHKLLNNCLDRFRGVNNILNAILNLGMTLFDLYMQT